MKKTTKTAYYRGVLVRAEDLDSRDEYVIELALNEKLFHKGNEEKLQKAIENSGNNHQVIGMIGNKFDFEYLRDSGYRSKITRIHEVISETDKEAQELIQMKLG